MGQVIQPPLKYLISHEKLIYKFPKEIILIYCFMVFLLLKSYLEAFYKFCKNHGDVTAEIMCPILEVRKSLNFFMPNNVLTHFSFT